MWNGTVWLVSNNTGVRFMDSQLRNFDSAFLSNSDQYQQEGITSYDLNFDDSHAELKLYNQKLSRVVRWYKYDCIWYVEVSH